MRVCSIKYDLNCIKILSAQDQKKKIQLFEEAAKKQTTIMEANIVGHGIDNHLLGLRELAKEHEVTMPQIFTDPVYKQMMQFDLSTSQVCHY